MWCISADQPHNSEDLPCCSGRRES
uniref:Uncharacterized protein n=1 Tax=Arundo donax TaxID=35708 RepID=A0A0A9G0Q2_ARUDO